jgi:predicted nucleotide-binding protein (sugar kinase/HSP70/actin superfamily)
MLLTFPPMGNMLACVRVMLDSLGLAYVLPLSGRGRALQLGRSVAPEFACLPLKIHLGVFMQAREKGADTILVAGGCGPCRFGYYCEMYREILADHGCAMDVISLEKPWGDLSGFVKRLLKLSGRKHLIDLPVVLGRIVRAAKAADSLERLAGLKRAREKIPGSVDGIMRRYLALLHRVSGWQSVFHLLDDTAADISAVEETTAVKPLRVGIVGEIYTNVDDDTAFNICAKLGRMGVEVRRTVTVSGWIVEHMLKGMCPPLRDRAFIKAAAPYLGAPIGGHARESVGNSVLLARDGFDGVIQLFPLTCMPEIVAQSILPSVSSDFDLPVLTLVIDELTGEAGYATRLEAFVDMLHQRREARGTGTCLSWH